MSWGISVDLLRLLIKPICLAILLLLLLRWLVAVPELVVSFRVISGIV